MTVEDKKYKIMTIRFHKDKDAELIKELEAPETSKRQWLHDLYYYKPELPKDLCSIADVERLLSLFKVDRRTSINIIDALNTYQKADQTQSTSFDGTNLSPSQESSDKET